MVLPPVEQFKRKYDKSRKIAGDRLRVGNDSSYVSLPEHVLMGRLVYN